MHLSGVGLVAFFGAQFSLGATFSLGCTKVFFDTDFAPTFGGKIKKNKTNVFFENAPQWHRSCCFLLGHNFRLGKTLSLGAQKPPLVQILPSHSGVKTKNKPKRFFITNVSQLRRSCCLFLGHNFRLGPHFSLGGPKTFFDTDFALTFEGKTKKKQNKRLF